jgi:hypothetical protein
MNIIILSNEKLNIEKYKFFSIRKILYFINLAPSNKSHRQQQQNSRDISARSVQGNNTLTYFSKATNISQYQ